MEDATWDRRMDRGRGRSLLYGPSDPAEDARKEGRKEEFTIANFGASFKLEGAGGD